MEETIKNNNSVERKFKITCCRSYLTPKGRCYTCSEIEEKEESEMDKDREEEE
ncbi:hypothetical protein HY494_01090 [Candidatus Woesearchaeota archaeon]|nr:hypothetical protein [Candidatus Woesearchaeota archaeon]